MEYAVGIILALATAAFARLSGFDRERAFYPTVLVVIASYYGLFAVLGGGEALGVEAAIAAAFAGAAVLGFRVSLWLVAAALIAHGLFDLVHAKIIDNPGTPGWWPGFCCSFDVVAGGYLAWLLGSGRRRASQLPGFGERIRPHVEEELRAASAAESAGDPEQAFKRLERAHVLGQSSTLAHVRVHARMLVWGLRHRRPAEVAGQALRIAGAATKTSAGLIPAGNTGGSNVSPFKSMPIPGDLAAIIASARVTTGSLLSVVAAAAIILSACATPPTDAQRADIDGHSVAYRVLGSGRPVVVMLAGLGDGMSTFDKVAPELAKSATVIVYDRSGYGGSSVAAGPRDAAGVERELAGLLRETGIPGPYVLAGHSIGGLFAEYYAARHPDQIAGLILEDSRPADFGRHCEAAGLSMCTPLPSMVKDATQGVRDEVSALTTAEGQVMAAGPAEGKPVLVLSRPASADEASFRGQWTAAQVGLAVRYPASRHLVAKSGGHYIHHDQRAWYLEVVQDFLADLN